MERLDMRSCYNEVCGFSIDALDCCFGRLCRTLYCFFFFDVGFLCFSLCVWSGLQWIRGMIRGKSCEKGRDVAGNIFRGVI